MLFFLYFLFSFLLALLQFSSSSASISFLPSFFSSLLLFHPYLIFFSSQIISLLFLFSFPFFLFVHYPSILLFLLFLLLNLPSYITPLLLPAFSLLFLFSFCLLLFLLLHLSSYFSFPFVSSSSYFLPLPVSLLYPGSLSVRFS